MLWMATQTLNHTLHSRGSRVLLYCSTAPRMKPCKCLRVLFRCAISVSLSHTAFTDFSFGSVSFVWQVYNGGGSVLGSDRSWLHLDRVQSHHWQPRLYPWGSEVPYVVTGGHFLSGLTRQAVFLIPGCCRSSVDYPRFPLLFMNADIRYVVSFFEKS